MNIIEFLKNEETNISDEDRATLLKEYYALQGKVQNLEADKATAERLCNERMELCKGALLSVRVLLQHTQCQTHRERNFECNAISTYIDKLITEMKNPFAINNIPF